MKIYSVINEVDCGTTRRLALLQKHRQELRDDIAAIDRAAERILYEKYPLRDVTC